MVCQIPLRSGLPPATLGARLGGLWPARGIAAAANAVPAITIPIALRIVITIRHSILSAHHTAFSSRKHPDFDRTYGRDSKPPNVSSPAPAARTSQRQLGRLSVLRSIDWHPFHPSS